MKVAKPATNQKEDEIVKIANIAYEARCSGCGQSFDAISYKPATRESGRVVCDHCLRRNRVPMSPLAAAVYAPEISETASPPSPVDGSSDG